MLKMIYMAGCLVLAGVFASCKKSTSYDVTGDSQIKFFINNEAAGNAPVNSISYNVVNYPDVAGSGWLNLSTTLPAQIQFPVFATRSVDREVVIYAEQDNSLVAAYNAAKNTSYAPFPEGILDTSMLAARIGGGQARSADSITIKTNLSGLNLLTEKAYMAPVRLKTVSNSAGVIASNTESTVAYIILNVERRRIKYLATTADVQGALITPRTNWLVSLTPVPSIVGSVVDGSTSTYSRWTEAQGQVDVNMQAMQNVTGMRIYTSSSSTYIPSQTDVYLSTDGINYDLIGSPLKANLTYASSYNYILFYKAIPAKYIRVKLSYSTSTSSSNRRIAEFDVYAN